MKTMIAWGTWDRNNKLDPARHSALAHSLWRYSKPFTWCVFLPYTHRWVRVLTKRFPDSFYWEKYQCQPVWDTKDRHLFQCFRSLSPVIILQRNGTKTEHPLTLIEILHWDAGSAFSSSLHFYQFRSGMWIYLLLVSLSPNIVNIVCTSLCNIQRATAHLSKSHSPK